LLRFRLRAGRPRRAAHALGTAPELRLVGDLRRQQRQKIIDALASLGITGDVPALHQDTPPIIDRYDALQPHADAANDAPIRLTTAADDQPFPFYGRVRVWWQ
jgi:hypothetical protein